MRRQDSGPRRFGMPQLPIAVVLLCIAVTTLACAPRLISDYDEVTDRSATELQKKVEGFIHQMVARAGTPNGTYTANTAFYDEARTDVSALRVRANAFDKNSLTVEQINLIQNNLDNLERLHQLGGQRGLRKEVADPALALLNSQFTGLIKLEVAKKRGQ
jgi:hypothetical protein